MNSRSSAAIDRVLTASLRCGRRPVAGGSVERGFGIDQRIRAQIRRPPMPSRHRHAGFCTCKAGGVERGIEACSATRPSMRAPRSASGIALAEQRDDAAPSGVGAQLGVQACSASALQLGAPRQHHRRCRCRAAEPQGARRSGPHRARHQRDADAVAIVTGCAPELREQGRPRNVRAGAFERPVGAHRRSCQVTGARGAACMAVQPRQHQRVRAPAHAAPARSPRAAMGRQCSVDAPFTLAGCEREQRRSARGPTHSARPPRPIQANACTQRAKPCHAR